MLRIDPRWQAGNAVAPCVPRLKRAARQKRHERIVAAAVGGQAHQREQAALAVELEAGGIGAHVMQQVLLRLQHAFRLTGRARRIHHPERRVGRDRDSRIGAGQVVGAGTDIE